MLVRSIGLRDSTSEWVATWVKYLKVAPSRNALLIQALQRYLEDLEQGEIDAHIAQMAEDAAYQNLHLRMVKEYEPAGWEALRLSEESS